MKKLSLISLFILTTVNLYTQDYKPEMQLSGGLEFGFGTLKIDNDFWYNNNGTNYFCSEKTDTVFFAPGISFTLRVFADINKNISTGLIFRDRAVFMTNMKQVETFSRNNISSSISETLTVSDDLFISIMDFGFRIIFPF